MEDEHHFPCLENTSRRILSPVFDAFRQQSRERLYIPGVRQESSRHRIAVGDHLRVIEARMASGVAAHDGLKCEC